MTLTIGYDGHTQAAEQYCQMNSDHQLLCGHYPWLEHLKKMTENDRLFTFWHHGTGRGVLAVWVYSPRESSRPVCMELETYTGHPSEEWPAGLLPPELMRERLRPVDEQVKKLNKRRRDKLNEARSRRVDNDYARREGARTARRLGLDQAAKQIASGAVPYDAATNPERTREVTQLLKDLRKAL